METRRKKAEEIMNRNKKEYSNEEIDELKDRLADLEPTDTPTWG
jgi:polyhydroxyalkanoate synthesis regulator phasin